MSETRTDLPRVQTRSGVRFGFNVRVQGARPELLLALMVVSNLCVERGIMVLVTHMLDGEHMHNSLHYSGAGVDFTVERMMDQVWMTAELKERLSRDYDVIDESTHIHIEYQPHTGAVT